MADRILDADFTFFRGCKSDGDPGQLQQGYYWMSYNMVNVGGALSCRPGYRCIVQFPKGNLQGATIFEPIVGIEQMVVCIDGVVYVSPWPFNEWKILPNVLMSPHAKQVFWCMARQSAQRLGTDLGAAIEVIRPRAVLFIQDGGATAPAWYDGSNSGHDRDALYGIPTGGPMVWVGDRLWVAQGNKVLASDIANPFSYRENVYLGSVSGFQFSSDVTAMSKTPSLEVPQLAVFTIDDATIIKANNRDRNSWPTTENMQTEILQVGCASQRSLTTHYGRLSWLSPSGIVLFDFATSGKLTVRIPIRDNEMLFSKTKLGDDLTLAAAASYGQFMLLSVPAEDLFNPHTWVLNDASIETLNDDSGPAWASIWTGTRPVEWVYGDIAGTNRIYHVSTDEDGENRLWESFTPDRLDNYCPITWAVFTRGYFGPTGITRREPGATLRMAFSDVALCGLAENVDVGVYYAGGMRGAFKPIAAKEVSIAVGSISYEDEITADTQIYGLKPQARKIRTQDAREISTDEDSGSCHVESNEIENLDENFQLLVVGHGPATIRWIRAFGYTEGQEYKGEPNACVSEEDFHAIRFDGAGVSSTDEVSGLAELGANPLPVFYAYKTVTLSRGNYTAVGVGSGESIVSQEAADRVAERIATRMAEIELMQVSSPVYSVGEGF